MHEPPRETAADLRRQLHAMKSRDREATVFAAQASATERFLKSSWFTALITGVAVFILLYITNPLFVHEPKGPIDPQVGGGADKYITPKPSLRRVTAWAVLAALLVALGPLAYQKFSAPQ